MLSRTRWNAKNFVVVPTKSGGSLEAELRFAAFQTSQRHPSRRARLQRLGNGRYVVGLSCQVAACKEFAYNRSGVGLALEWWLELQLECCEAVRCC